MSIRLTCIDAVPSSADVELNHLPATIGRGDEADVCIRDTWASRVHVRLTARDGKLWIEDMRSSNGTLLNGEPVASAIVNRGDLISVGITTFRVTYSRLPAMDSSKVGAANQLSFATSRSSHE